MKWKDYYRIGDDQIDEQHKQLIMNLEDLLKALSKGGKKARAQCESMVDFMDSFVMVHFSTEEIFQQKINYSLLKEHKAAHEDFIVTAREAKYSLMRCDFAPDQMKEYAQMLTRWVMYHVMQEDRKMIPEIPKDEE